MAVRLSIPNDFQNFVKAKYKYVQAYNNALSFDGNLRKEIFLIKSRLSTSSDKQKLLYIMSNFFRLISNKYADFTVGRGIVVEFGDDTTNQSIIEVTDGKQFNTKLYDTIVKTSYAGYGIIRIINKDGNPQIQKIPVSNYFAKTSNLSIGSDFDDINTHYIVTVERVEDDTGKKEWFTHVDRYEREGKGRRGIYEKYKYKASLQFKDDDFVEEKGNEFLPYLPIFVFQNDIIQDEEVGYDDINNDKGTGFVKQFFSESDYVDIFDIVQEINDRNSQTSVEFIQNLKSKISVPLSYIEELKKRKAFEEQQAKINGTAVERTVEQRLGRTSSESMGMDFDWITHGPGETPAQYLTKSNPMIDQAFTVVSKYIRTLAAITAIPVSLFGLEEVSGNKLASTDNNEFEAFYERIEKKRTRLYPVLQKLFAYVNWIINDKYELPTIKFPKLKSRNLKEKIDAYTIMKSDGVLSNQSYLEGVFGYDAEEAQEELDKVASDMKIDNEITGKFLPSLTGDK